MNNNRIRAWAVLFWLAVWQMGAMALDSDILLVSPVGVLLRLGQLLPTADFWRSVLFSFGRISSGFIIGAVTATLLAALAHRYKLIRELVAPLMLAIRSVPVASFIILVLVWFSSKTLSVLIAFLMVLPIIYSGVLTGISTCDRQLIEMAKVFKLSNSRCIRYIYLPQVIPFFRSGCGSALGLCWKAGIAAEVIGMPVGSIGEKLQQAKVYLDTPDLFAWTLVIVLVSLLFERIFMLLLNKAERMLARV